MRRDICFIFPVDISRLYNAYVTVATNSRFRRECRQEPYHTLSFGLNFSMKYNFNGGSCTIRFIPVEGGSAVNLRFSLAQLAGGRYEKYARDLTDEVIALLGVTPVCADIDINAFLSPQNRVVAGSHTAYSTPSSACQQSPTPSPSPNPYGGKFCTRCGQQLPPEALFCSSCGNKL